LPVSERIENADRFLTNPAALIQHDGNRAFYSPARDTIQLPPFEAPRDKESYYATALHEATHWSGAKHRLGAAIKAHRSLGVSNTSLRAEQKRLGEPHEVGFAELHHIAHLEL
jgi:antirestriction protein ArdC